MSDWILAIGIVLALWIIIGWFIYGHRAIYCGRCGTKLEERVLRRGFNRANGALVTETVHACPNRPEPPNWDDYECFAPYPDEAVDV